MIASIYTQETYSNLRPLYANWQPNNPIQLGDFGYLSDKTFIHQGNISKFGIKFERVTSATKTQQHFVTSGTTDVAINAAGSGPVPIGGVPVNLKANIVVTFSSNRAVFFNAAGCAHGMILDKNAVGQAIMELYKAKKWQRGWCVVTDTITADSLAVAVSGGRGSSITFEPEANVPAINLADAKLGLKVANSKNVGFQLTSSDPTIPLFGLCRIKPRFLWFDDNFYPLAMARSSQTALATLEADESVRTEHSPDDLIFSQEE